jgi:protein-L-isoaspartate O-methyltransferase
MALAELFPSVIGADIAAPMLETARQTADEFNVRNVEWLLTNKFGVYDNVGPFDVFFSLIVLQHNPPPIQGWLLSILLGKLRPGGLGYFQIPTYRRGYEFRVRQYMAEGSVAQIEMHIYPMRRLLRLIAECGCELLDIRENGAAGTDPGLISNTFLVQKL